MADPVQDPSGLVFTGQTIPILIGTLILALQQYIQYRSTRRLDADQLRYTIKLELYEKLMDAMDVADKAIGQFGSLLEKIKLDLEQSKHLDEQLWRGSLSYYVSTEELSLAQRDFHDKCIIFAAFLERHDVVVPSLKKFRSIIGAKVTELSELYYKKLTEKLRWSLPLKKDSELYLNSVRRLPPNQVDEIKGLMEVASSLRFDISSYFMDLSVFAQNELLGKLFKRAVTGRKPILEKYAVIEGND